MELILLTNLAFSVVGFVFIFRMWKEVKERRDYYGENFTIPRGNDHMESGHDAPCVVPNAWEPSPAVVSGAGAQPVQGGMSVEQITQMVVQAMNQANVKPDEAASGMASDGDMQKLIANVMASSGGGR